MIVPHPAWHQQNASVGGCQVATARSRLKREVSGAPLMPRYCAAIQANTHAASWSLSAGRASGMGAPQGGVGESF